MKSLPVRSSPFGSWVLRLGYAASAAAIAAAFLTASPPRGHTYSSGAPSGFSGPEQNCSACHSDFAPNSGTGSVTILAPSTYAPGDTIQITVVVHNTTPQEGSPRRTGFEASVRDAATLAHTGTLDLGGSTRIQFADGLPEWVTHTGTGNADTSWTFFWRPPAVGGPDTVRIYAAGNAANTDFTPSGDYIYTASHAMARMIVGTEPGPAPGALAVEGVFPNPVRSSAEVAFRLRRAAPVSLALRDGRGRLVRAAALGP
ncbi:MAG TPA: choice-of-anchor V domain-containing protein, partial [Rubricoccaceae bacterium]|nr:choice-of-anchor V domain-containing protein [Rubricoccaceae bacterium]